MCMPSPDLTESSHHDNQLAKSLFNSYTKVIAQNPSIVRMPVNLSSAEAWHHLGSHMSAMCLFVVSAGGDGHGPDPITTLLLARHAGGKVRGPACRAEKQLLNTYTLLDSCLHHTRHGSGRKLFLDACQKPRQQPVIMMAW